MAKLSDAEWAQARAVWEADPKVNFVHIAAEFNVTKQAVALRAKKDGWQKQADMPHIVREAHRAADAKSLPPPKVGKKGAQPEPAEKPKVERTAPAMLPSPQDRAEAVNRAVDHRAELLSRHRAEWEGVRALVQAAVDDEDFDKAKLGKITSEATKIIQEGERKAWGIDQDQGDDKSKTTIVIERRDESTARHAPRSDPQTPS
jgi:vacuolar-type H+-ATPase subunit H